MLSGKRIYRRFMAILIIVAGVFGFMTASLFLLFGASFWLSVQVYFATAAVFLIGVALIRQANMTVRKAPPRPDLAYVHSAKD